MMRRLLMVMALLAAMATPAAAEIWWPQWVTVIRPESGDVVAFLKADGGPHRNQWRAEDVKRFPYMKTLTAASPAYPGALTAAERRQAAKVGLPTSYDGRMTKPYLLRRTPGGSWVVFLEYVNDRETPEGKYEGVLGRFVLVDPRTGGVKRALPGEFRFQEAGRSRSWKPGVALWQRYWMPQKGAQVPATDVDNGEPLFESPSVFADVRDLDGGWLAGDRMYLNTVQGLKRVNPESGHTDWVRPQVGGHVEWVGLNKKDGLLYVHSVYEPVVYDKELRKAAKGRYPSGQQGYATVVQVGGELYGATWVSPPTDPNAAPTQVAVWRRGDDEWAWLFDYDTATMSSGQMDALYQRKKLPAALRSRLEASPP